MKNEMKIDWSRSFLEPISYELTDDGLRVSAAGEEITFRGKLLTIAPACVKVRVDASMHTDKMVVLSAAVRAVQTDKIKLVSWFDGEWEGYDELLDYNMTFTSICTFLRKGKVSFFVSLDFPYSKAERGKISYDPFDAVEADTDYEVYTMTIGVARLTGDFPLIGGEPGLCDRGEIEGFAEYVENRYPNRFERPVNSTVCITNRMTYVREGRIFYSMYDQPTVALDPETLHKEIDLCAELGIEYDQIFEGYFDFPDGYDCDKTMQELTAHGREVGVRVGGYITANGPYCPHYDYAHRDLGHPEWLRRDKNGNTGGWTFPWHCLASGYTDYVVNIMVDAAKRNGDEMINIDMWLLGQCCDPNHLHSPDSVFGEVRGLVKMMQAFADIAPEFLVWTNAGSINEIAPKIAWYNPNMYLTDPHPRDYSSTMSMLKFYGDCRREQMVTVHNKYFVPYRYFTNCEYYVFRHSRVDNLNFFEYSFLQGLCVNPNICLAELRTFLERVPAAKLDYCKRFIREWIAFIKENFDVWKHTYQIVGFPGESAGELYAHVKGGEGFLCFVNQNQQTVETTFTLDQAVGLSEGEKFLLYEEYPHKMPIAEQAIPYATYGDSITISVPAESVRIIRIMPYTPADGIRLYGIEGDVTKTEDGYRLNLSGLLGETYPLAIALALEQVESITAAPVPTVPMYTFPTNMSEVEKDGNLARFELTMPRDRFNRELACWSVDGGPVKQIDPIANGFRGAYIHNFYQEHTPVTVDIKTKAGAPSEGRLLPAVAPMATELDNGRGSIYEIDFPMPFIEFSLGALQYGFDEVLELVFANPSAVESITATIDGVPCEISRFYYSTRDMYAYYIELTGILASGTTPHLKLEIKWAEQVAEQTSAANKASSSDGVQVLGQ